MMIASSNITRQLFSYLILLIGYACQTKETAYQSTRPPVAAKMPHEIVSQHGHKRIDDYYWLKNREDSAVINYLTLENKYRDTILSHTKALQRKLFQEMKGRIKEEDASVPYKIDNYFYYTRYVKGGEYPIFCRKKDALSNSEEIVADGNAMGQGHAYFNFSAYNSPDHRMVALVMDTVGRNFYTIKIKNLDDGKMKPEKIGGTTGDVVWTNDNKTILYCTQDTSTLRANKIYRHKIGTHPSTDVLVYEEKDETLSCSIGKTRSKKYFIISLWRTDASAAYYMDADKGMGTPTIIEPLQDNVHYDADHFDGKFYIRTNDNAKNYRLVEAPERSPGKKYWKDVVPNRDHVLLENFEIFKNYLALEETAEGISKLRLIRWKDRAEHVIPFDETAYLAGLDDNPEASSNTLRFYYESMTTPSSVYDYEMTTHDRKLMKQQVVLGGFDRTLYHTERIMATARDGVNIPMSIVYKKSTFKKDGTNPCVQYAYGAYGSSMQPYFSSKRISLLDRGFVYAIAHVRGGQEMGGQWYEDGKMAKKKNTFYDFIDCSKFLVAQQYTSHDKLFAHGGSAGGLLMGVISNMAPELYKGIIADVPFVDVMTTMMDETIPLTTFEWKEWGNPNIKAEYEYMLSYSPYDNVTRQAYPNMLVLTGLHDSQVQYWEPAKWVAKLRATKTDNNWLLLSTNMDAGHGGASGRFQSLKDDALIDAFMLDLVGIKE